MEILENGIYIYIFYSISFKIYKYLLLSILDNFIFFADGGAPKEEEDTKEGGRWEYGGR